MTTSIYHDLTQLQKIELFISRYLTVPYHSNYIKFCTEFIDNPNNPHKTASFATFIRAYCKPFAKSDLLEVFPPCTWGCLFDLMLIQELTPQQTMLMELSR